MITDVPGVRVGHWTGDVTGVTVIVLPPDTTASCEIRGGAPATRETALLEPGRTVQHVDAIVLSGGSAFGLVTADGVMRGLAELGRGFPTRGGPVPIVPAAAIFDLVASGGVLPGMEEGRAALAAAMAEPAGPLPIGLVGAGRGATVGKWRGGETRHARWPRLRERHATVTSWSARWWSSTRSATSFDAGRSHDRRVERARRHRRLSRGAAVRRRRPTPRWRSSRPTRGARSSSATSSRGARTTGWPGRSIRRTPVTTATSRSRLRDRRRSTRTSTDFASWSPR